MESLYNEREDKEDGSADEELGTVNSYSDDENYDDDDDGGVSDDREEDKEEEAKEEEEEEERGGKWTGGGGDYFDVGIGLWDGGMGMVGGGEDGGSKTTASFAVLIIHLPTRADPSSRTGCGGRPRRRRATKRRGGTRT
jgi:hypothetical protein